MRFNFFLVLFCVLVLMFSLGEHHKRIMSLPAPTTMPDKVMDSVVVLESLLLVLTSAPAPMPRYSPLIVPIYHARSYKSPLPTQSNPSRRIPAIYKWVAAFYARFTNHTDRPQPTKVSHIPTKVIVPVQPAPPAAAHYILCDAPVQSPTSSEIDLVGLWNTYKLILGWIVLTCSVAIRVFARFLSRDRDCAHPAAPDASPLAFESIIDMYYSLGFPPVASSDLETFSGLDSDLANYGNSTPKDRSTVFEFTASSSPTPIDAASILPLMPRVDGMTCMDSASVGDKTLEPAVNSIGSKTGLCVAGNSPAITPSSSLSSVASSSEDLLARYPPVGQVHTPRTKRWLEKFINQLQGMERQGNYHGRVYDGWSSNPEREPQVEASEPRSTSSCRADSGYPSEYATASLQMPSRPSFASELSCTTSQGSLYEVLEDLVNTGLEQVKVEGEVERGVEEDDEMFSSQPSLAEILLLPRPRAQPKAAIAQGEVKVEVSLRVVGINSRNDPLPSSPSPRMSSRPSFVSELSCTVSQDSLYDLLGSLVDPVTRDTEDDQGTPKGEADLKAKACEPLLCPANVPLPPSPSAKPKALKAQEVINV
ncbi:putative transmembrane protein [Rhizoctonia solani 123E]|uniref:Putative transmembrane protein n=1 Tax=Rhizoctonia solani 123E TaxID=1423351 RepID=A0A074RW15_9AGAM|nr:putative transmembrane protein [Rhizoctonia solani 123E]